MGKSLNKVVNSDGFPASAHDGEGVVHGHIHNYDNMTYIHGHVHGHQKENSEPTDLAGPQDVLAPLPSLNAMSNEDLCRKYVDCKHFEFVNYHASKQLSDTINNGNLGFNDDGNSCFSGKEKALNNDINDTTTNRDMARIGNNDSYRYLDNGVSDKGTDQMLMPRSKKRTFSDVINNITDDKCDCNPKILEVCCDMPHVPSSAEAEEGLLAPFPSVPRDDDLIVCTGTKNNFLEPPAANENYSKKDSSDIDCNLTCICPQELHDSLGEEEEEEEEEEDKETDQDIFEKFCKECMDLNQQASPDDLNFQHPQSHHRNHHHHHHHHQYPSRLDDKSYYSNPMTTPSSSTASSFDEGLQKGNIATDSFKSQLSGGGGGGDHSALCHDHVFNSNMDLKILDDLCDISSLYELPFANHMNHHNHSHNRIPGHSNQVINLLLPTIDGNENCKNDGGKEAEGPHNHHHHRIQFHQHGHQPSTSEGNNAKTALPLDQNKNTLTNPELQEDQKSVFHHHHHHHYHHHHHDPPNNYKDNNLDTGTNTIDFNWSFKNEDLGQLKCEWNQCYEQFPSLIGLQKHMFKDHVPQEDVSSNLLCNWNDCEFKGEDICSLVNHINSDHGINFGMRVLDNASLAEQGEQHHLLHRPDQASPNKSSKLECQWDDCDQYFSTAADLSSHLEKFHLPRGQSEYHCYWKGCSRKFTQRQKMVRHLKVHSGYKPFKCQVCSKFFSNEDTLNQHTRTHSGEKPFQCHLCGKRFSVSSSLKIHIRTHTGEKPLQCKVCGKRFNESSNLNKHLKTHRKKYKCNFCPRSFDDIEKAKLHELSCISAPPKLAQV